MLAQLCHHRHPVSGDVGRILINGFSGSRGTNAGLCRLTLACVLTLFVRCGQADDQVTLRGTSAAARMTINGTVEDYTGVEITVRTEAQEPPRTFPARDVTEVRTSQTAAHTEGLELLAAGRVDEALGKLETALKKETRAWVRREIVAQLVRGALRRGDYVSAGARFQALVRSDPETRHFPLIPLLWDSQRVPTGTREEARHWLAGNSEPGRLIGASLLWGDPESGQEARAVIKKLSSSPDPRIQVLAQTQAWRDAALEGNPGKLQTAQWQRRLNEIPESLRAGPSYLLGTAYAARHDYEMAAATWLWLPLVDDHDHRLAARACLEAGRALDKIGQHEEARTLYHEVVDRFADTPAAEEALPLLQRDTPSPP